MAGFYYFVIILTIIENSHQYSDYIDDLALIRSFGFSSQNLPGRLYSDPPITVKNLQQYNDMMRDGMESFERFDDREKRRLRRLIGDHSFEAMLEGVFNSRRNGARRQSAAGQRRSRSQSFRRAKLDNQSRRSHVQYSKL